MSKTQTISVADLSAYLTTQGVPNDVRGADDVMLSGCNTLDAAGDGELTFLANPKYRDRLAGSNASAIIMREDEALDPPMTQLRCSDPYQALTHAVIQIHGFRRHPHWGVGSGAYVDPTATVGVEANLAPGATICADAVVGDRVVLYPGAYIGPGTVVGDDVVLFPNVVVYDGCRLGNRVTIHAGSVIGEDGLGYAPVAKKWVKIPQAGGVVIEDDVEIGAGCAIDRATLGTTRIGAGTKFSNQIAVGHGCQIGNDCMFVAQVGLAGSVHVGDRVMMAGQAGVVGHIAIGDDAMIGAQAGVTSQVKPGEFVLGAPAAPVKETRRQLAAVQRLPEIRRRMREMARELEALKAQLAEVQESAAGAHGRTHGEPGSR